MNDGSIDNQAKSQAILKEHKISNKCLIVLARFLAFYLSSCACVYITAFCFSCGCDFIQRITDFFADFDQFKRKPVCLRLEISQFLEAYSKLLLKFRIRSSCRFIHSFVVQDLTPNPPSNLEKNNDLKLMTNKRLWSRKIKQNEGLIVNWCALGKVMRDIQQFSNKNHLGNIVGLLKFSQRT